MLETALSADAWVGAIIGGIVTGLMGWLHRLALRYFPVILNATWSSVRKWARARRKIYLLRIKAIRFDSMRINREIARSYAFLVLFLVSSMFYAVTLLLAPRPAAITVLWALALGIPVLIAEVLWLFSSSKVDALLKSRARIISRGRRLR